MSTSVLRATFPASIQPRRYATGNEFAHPTPSDPYAMGSNISITRTRKRTSAAASLEGPSPSTRRRCDGFRFCQCALFVSLFLDVIRVAAVLLFPNANGRGLQPTEVSTRCEGISNISEVIEPKARRGNLAIRFKMNLRLSSPLSPPILSDLIHIISILLYVRSI